MRFNPSDSKTYESLSSDGRIKYAKGEVEGFYGRDLVSFQGITANSTVLFADYRKDISNPKTNGLIGLANGKITPNIFDIAYHNNQLISSTFVF